jgi:hypothetical protein
MAKGGALLVDGPFGLDPRGPVRSDPDDVGRDGQTWWYRRKDGADDRTHTATSLAELHKMIADDYAFLPMRRAS